MMGLFSLLCILFGSAAAAQSPITAPPYLAGTIATEYRLGTSETLPISVQQRAGPTPDTCISKAGLESNPLLHNIKIGYVNVNAAKWPIAECTANGNFVKLPQVISALVTQARGNPALVPLRVNRLSCFPLESADLHPTTLPEFPGGIPVSRSNFATLVGTRGPQRIRKDMDQLSFIRSADSGGPILGERGRHQWSAA
jgi:hypothetical protein